MGHLPNVCKIIATFATRYAETDYVLAIVCVFKNDESSQLINSLSKPRINLLGCFPHDGRTSGELAQQLAQSNLLIILAIKI